LTIIEPRAGLAAADRAAIADLEARAVTADGGRLKLEWGVLNARPSDRTQDLLANHDGRLVGFLGLYGFGPEQVELAGMVDPEFRRRGIGSELLAAALPLVAEAGYASTLLVCAHADASAAFAKARGGTFDHAEHAMLLSGPPLDGPTNPSVTLRTGTVDDIAEITRLLEAGFDHPAGDVAARLRETSTENLVIELDGVPIGYVRLTLDGDRGGVYGFVIDPVLQGRGIGRDVLRRCCVRLADAGARQVGLEVAVDNERALGLYTSLGFERVTTEDYFVLPRSTP
jgi:ribosomal protein S18 acetylase RimI-like enzyme